MFSLQTALCVLNNPTQIKELSTFKDGKCGQAFIQQIKSQPDLIVGHLQFYFLCGGLDLAFLLWLIPLPTSDIHASGSPGIGI